MSAIDFSADEWRLIAAACRDSAKAIVQDSKSPVSDWTADKLERMSQRILAENPEPQ